MYLHVLAFYNCLFRRYVSLLPKPQKMIPVVIKKKNERISKYWNGNLYRVFDVCCVVIYGGG